MTATIGLDVGGTNVRGAVVTSDGEVVSERYRPTPDGERALLDALLGVITDLRDDPPDVVAVGVGIAGLVDFDGVVHYAPNIHGILGVPLRAALADATGLPVVVDNDANVAAWGEARFGAAAGCNNCLLITLGTGVGGGIVTDGHLYRGGHGFAAEIGHFQVDPNGPLCACGERGHWEAIASGTALGRMAREAAAAGDLPSVLQAAAGDVDVITGYHVTAAVKAGAPDALALLRTYAGNVAIGLTGLANILDPTRIVVSGGLIELGETLLGPIREALAGHIEGASRRPQPEIVAATLGEKAGMIGAAALALHA